MDTTVNIRILCRLCSSKTQELKRIHMFDITGVLLDVKSKIRFCLGIDINENDNLPQVICSDCVDKVDNFSKFKKDAEKTTDLLQGLLNQQADSIENSQNSCNIEETVFDTANYISDPEEMVIKADDSDSFSEQLDTKVILPSTNKIFKNHRKKKLLIQQNNKNLKSIKKANKKLGAKKLNATNKQKKPKPVFYECEICQKTFSSRLSIYKHVLIHFKVKNKANITYNCSYCIKKYRSKLKLSQHIKSEHKNVQNNSFVLDSPSYDTVNNISDPQDNLYQVANPHSIVVDNFQTSIPSIKNKSSPVKCKKSKKHIKVKTSKKKCKSKNIVNKKNGVVKLTEVPQLVPKIYECDICKRTFSRRSNIMVHIRYHMITEKKIECSFCMKKFKTIYQVKRHIVNKHTREKKFICDCCGNSFYNKGSFDYHIHTKHVEILPFECEKCNKKFAVLSLLRSHVRNRHNENKLQWVCDICGKSVSSKNSLAKHKLRHEKTPEELQALKIYKCLVCDARYDHPCNLKYHMRMHTQEKLFECKICKKSYTRKNGYNVHLLTHTGERQFVCDVCGKAFAIKKNLNIHKLIHTGERRFQCNDCDKTYTQNSSLNIHLKKTGHTRKRI